MKLVVLLSTVFLGGVFTRPVASFLWERFADWRSYRRWLRTGSPAVVPSVGPRWPSFGFVCTAATVVLVSLYGVLLHRYFSGVWIW